MKTTLAFSLLIILTALSLQAQNTLTCEVDKKFRKNTIYELKDNEQQVVANLSQLKRDAVIRYGTDQYYIKKHRSWYYVFYDSVFSDTVAVMHNKNITIKERADNSEFVIKHDKKGWKISENEDISLKVGYSEDQKKYDIEIKSPAYNDHLINSLACYYAIRKCKEIYESQFTTVTIITTMLTTQ